jgi:hypothetical protein
MVDNFKCGTQIIQKSTFVYTAKLFETSINGIAKKSEPVQRAKAIGTPLSVCTSASSTETLA